jgi:hypothetical protein
MPLARPHLVQPQKRRQLARADGPLHVLLVRKHQDGCVPHQRVVGDVLELGGGALDAVAVLALTRGTGARGLRSILEDVLLDTMFDLPGRKDVVRCTVTAASVRKEEPPVLTMRKATRTRRAS